MDKLKELYAYRQMLISLVKKDLRGRYKASVLGFFWTFINPLLQLLVYTVVFSVVMRASIEKFYIFVFVALVPWIFFSSSLTGGANIIVMNQDMIQKIYFPRIILPISYVTSCFVNMLFSFIVIFAVLFVTGYGFNFVACLFLPLIMIIEYILALGLALITSACTVYLRDLEHILGIVSMAWMCDLSLDHIAKLLALVGIVRIGRTSRLQRQTDRLHLVLLGIGDDPFDPRLSVRFFFDEVVLL